MLAARDEHYSPPCIADEAWLKYFKGTFRVTPAYVRTKDKIWNPLHSLAGFAWYQHRATFLKSWCGIARNVTRDRSNPCSCGCQIPSYGGPPAKWLPSCGMLFLFTSELKQIWQHSSHIWILICVQILNTANVLHDCKKCLLLSTITFSHISNYCLSYMPKYLHQTCVFF